MADDCTPFIRGRFTEPDRYAAALGGWKVDVLTSDAGRFDVDIEQLRIGPLRVARQTNERATHVRGTAPDDEVTVAIPTQPGAPMVWNGACIRDDTVMIAPAGTAGEGVLPARGSVLGVGLQASAANGDLIETITHSGPAARVAPSSRRRLSSLIPSILDEVERNPERVESAGFLHAVTRDVVGAMEETLSSGVPIATTRRASSRQEAVRRAERLALERLATPLTIEMLCRAAGLGERALRDAFVQLRGASPMRFVRALRLRCVRRELLRADPSKDKVTEVALRCGFWHLGRFSAAYRAAFGEPPSATLRRPC